jgi:hypothetical protein
MGMLPTLEIVNSVQRDFGGCSGERKSLAKSGYRLDVFSEWELVHLKR